MDVVEYFKTFFQKTSLVLIRHYMLLFKKLITMSYDPSVRQERIAGLTQIIYETVYVMSKEDDAFYVEIDTILQWLIRIAKSNFSLREHIGKFKHRFSNILRDKGAVSEGVLKKNVNCD
jgi:hypothetical protein